MPASWFDLLSVEMDTLSPGDILEPDTAVSVNDHVAGYADTDLELQKLYTIGMRLKEAGERAFLDAKWAKGDEVKQEFLNRARELHEKGDLVLDVFWISIYDSFQLWGRHSIGIREGWQVVWSDQDTSLPPFLRRLFGDPQDLS